ncbi:MAG: protein translocase subunit SecD [Anaerolineales bacterium]|nr:protein translocase subunit SecD [Anaerolineales bacterium]
MRVRQGRRLIFIVILIAAALWVVWPGNPGIHLGSYNRDIRVVRGLDLQGGLRVLLVADLPPETEVTSEQMQTARDIIDKRVNGLGLTEPLIQIAGGRRILVELPGIGDPQQAVNIIKETGLLEFIQMTRTDQATTRIGQVVRTDFETASIIQTQPSVPANAGGLTPSPAVTTEPRASASPTVSTTESDSTETTPTTAEPEPKVFHTVMTGAELISSGVIKDSFGAIKVSIEFNEVGAKIFAEYTATHIGEPLGIVFDKQLISAPSINSAIPQGRAVIQGSFTAEEANNLAIQLRYGSLPVPLKVIESKTVGPTLGQDSLQKSTKAGIIGLVVVIVFMMLYYRLPGLVADLALLVYATITFALFKLIPVTLTLPGIAGFVLSIGVAVDANILIFERMKEELRRGETLYQAIDLGFSRAWPSIRDSNLSTLITCAILYWFGNAFGASIVKGFSLTLALGVLISLFTAITVTRTFLHTVLDTIRRAEHPRLFGL